MGQEREGREGHFPLQIAVTVSFRYSRGGESGGWCKREKVEKAIFPFRLLLRSRVITGPVSIF
jgi:hypothetical protein